MGHRDLKTTQIYADYMAGEREAQLVDAAFGGQLVANPATPRNPTPSKPPETLRIYAAQHNLTGFESR
jgi:hypothetical protein